MERTREPRQIQSPSLSPITHGSSSSSSSHPHYHHLHLLLLVQSFILNLRLGFSANHFLHMDFFLFFPTGLILRTLGRFNVFILLNGWICLHGVLD